ncbi:MAG: hypothetical protein HG457_007875 [Flavobacteriaceae bacterium]|nr:hypothetical protein [Flavobacteriaceae bacterium]
MDDILEGFLWIFFYFFLFLLGVYGAYLKLYDKNSWLYKESQQEKWPYNFDSQSSWRIILLLIIGGGVAFLAGLIGIISDIIKKYILSRNIMNELLKYVLICVVSFIISFVGFWGAYLKLYDKNSWLYKESEGKNWLYDLSGMRSWGLIFAMIVWIIGFYTSLYEIIAKLIELFKK